VSGFFLFFSLLADVGSLGVSFVTAEDIIPKAVVTHLDTVFIVMVVIRLTSVPVGVLSKGFVRSLPDVVTFLSVIVKANKGISADVSLNGIILFFVFRRSEFSSLSVTGLFSFFPGLFIIEESVFYSSSFPLSCGLCLILEAEGISISGKGGDDGEFGVHI
jgi:hypothetical protein